MGVECTPEPSWNPWFGTRFEKLTPEPVVRNLPRNLPGTPGSERGSKNWPGTFPEGTCPGTFPEPVVRNLPRNLPGTRGSERGSEPAPFRTCPGTFPEPVIRNLPRNLPGTCHRSRPGTAPDPILAKTPYLKLLGKKCKADGITEMFYLTCKAWWPCSCTAECPKRSSSVGRRIFFSLRCCCTSWNTPRVFLDFQLWKSWVKDIANWAMSTQKKLDISNFRQKKQSLLEFSSIFYIVLWNIQDFRYLAPKNQTQSTQVSIEILKPVTLSATSTGWTSTFRWTHDGWCLSLAEFAISARFVVWLKACKSSRQKEGRILYWKCWFI